MLELRPYHQHYLISCATFMVTNSKECDIIHAQQVASGYEGSMLRADKPYDHKRSHYLLKRKDFQEDDFQVVGISEGRGKNEGTAILECSCDGGKQTFTCTAPGTYERKAEILRNRSTYKMEYVKVKFQNFTEDGIPRFPVALGFRDD
jgi:DNA ligase-1